MNCERHGLAAQPDGKCVLCRREERQRGSRIAWVGVGLVLGLAVAATAAVRLVGSRPPPATLTAVASAPAPVANAAAPVLPPSAARPGPSRALESPAVRPGDRPAASVSVASAAAPVAAAPPPAPPPVSTEREARVRAAMRRVPVTLYMEQWCGASQKARAWLRANDIDYREIDLTASPAAEPEFKRLSPQGTIPVLDIDGTVLVGFRPDAVEAALRRVAAAKVRE